MKTNNAHSFTRAVLPLITLFSMAIAFQPLTAQANQTAHVGAQGAKVFATASATAKVVTTLPAGKAITVGDQPTKGFYRWTSGKKSGWVHEADVVIKTAAAVHETPVARQAPAERAEGFTPQISAGLIGGLGLYGSTGAFAFGVDGSYRFNPEWGTGLFITYGSLGSASATAASTVTVSGGGSITIVAGEANYFFSGELERLHATGKLGLAVSSASASATVAGVNINLGGGSSTGIAIGAGAGYDYPINHNFSVGGEANLLIVSGAGSSTAIHLLAAAKYWF